MTLLKAESNVAFKDHGAGLLGVTPAHWRLCRLKETASFNPSKFEIKDIPKECTFAPMEKLKTDSLLTDTNILTSEVSGSYTYFRENDILVAKVTPCFENRNIAIAKNLTNGFGFGSSEINVVRISSKSHSRWFFYLFLSSTFIEAGASKMAGAGGLKRIPTMFLETFTFGLPPYAEQVAIAAYLDAKTAQIDRRIELLQKKGKKYGELKQALINETVTRGMVDSVPMKDSGVSRLGQVPEHWELKRIKEVCEINKNTLTEKTQPNYEFDYVDIGSVTYGVREYAKERMTFDAAPSRAKRIVRKGDTIISTVRTYLKAITTIDTDVEDLIVSTGFAVISPRKKLSDRYCSYLLTSDCIVDEICARSNGVSYPATNATVIGDLFFLLPPLSEQVAIGEYLDEKIAKMDLIVDAINSKIEKLKDLRKVLIDDVVIGKIKVAIEEQAL